MIIVKLIGGLGNQLFQYATGRHLAIKNKTTLKLDLSEFETYKLHAYSLAPFAIDATVASKEEVAHFKRYQRKPGRKWFLYNRLIADQKKYFQERQFHFDPEVLELKDPVYLDGFWQTEKYFKDIEETLRKEITLKVPLAPLSMDMAHRIAAEGNPVSMHIRRADYVKNPETMKFHGTCSIEYYLRAADIISKKVHTPHFFIFSDDPQWVKENIKLNHPTTYVDHNKADKNYEDLHLMSLCKHHVLANSSFSWWGAWLDRNPNKVVIAPAKWFAQTKASVKTHDLTPDNWIRL